jgi:putative aldouronate transport system permease protein
VSTTITGRTQTITDLDAAAVLDDTQSTRRSARPKRRRPARLEPFTLVSYVCVTLFGLFCLIPLWMIIAGSFTDESSLARTGYSLWPAPFSTAAYQMLFSGGALVTSYGASLFITIVGTALSLSCTASLAWVIARRLPRISRPLTIFAYIPMLFTGGLVPLYLLVTQVLSLNNNWFAVILPVMLAPFLIFVAVSFFRQLPEEILDSARIDGAGELRIFFQVALRMLAPGFVTVLLFTLVATWNNYFLPLIMLNSSDLYPITVGLAQLQAAASQGGGSQALFSTVITGSLVSIVPLVLAFLFLQRYWQSGLATGSVKE